MFTKFFPSANGLCVISEMSKERSMSSHKASDTFIPLKIFDIPKKCKRNLVTGPMGGRTDEKSV
jgi:hypothetical protein